jgi:uncharacterized protein (TIGR00255 family)
MTGFGDARIQTEQVSVAVEVRSVNNRYLKISTKIPEAYTALESEIERVVRQFVARGTVTVTARVKRLKRGQQYVLDRDVFEEYWRQMSELSESMHLALPSDLGALLQLPGVVTEAERPPSESSGDWPAIRQAVVESLEELCAFRTCEGEPMRQDLQKNGTIIAEQLDQIAALAPQVVVDFRDRLRQRVGELLERTGVAVDDAHLIREVSIFSERCDINEEITRLRSHLQQFEVFLAQETSQGRKLEFLSQEIFREVNTIGSKANNVSISIAVVEMKAAIEKMREVLQNVE